MKRVRRNARDDLVREVSRKGLRSEVEGAEWMNSFSTLVFFFLPLFPFFPFSSFLLFPTFFSPA